MKIFICFVVCTLSLSINLPAQSARVLKCPAPTLNPVSNFVPIITTNSIWSLYTYNLSPGDTILVSISGPAYTCVGSLTLSHNGITMYTCPTASCAYKISQPGYYAAWYDNRWSDNSILINQSSVGIQQVSNETVFNLYPVPASDYINIECTISGYSYKIIDLCGKTISDSENNNGNASVDISNFPPGIYAVLINDHGVTSTRKFIKQ